MSSIKREAHVSLVLSTPILHMSDLIMWMEEDDIDVQRPVLKQFPQVPNSFDTLKYVNRCFIPTQTPEEDYSEHPQMPS